MRSLKPKPHKPNCEWPECTTKPKNPPLCAQHRLVKRPAGEPRGWYLMGDRNPHWKGGIFEYKNYSELKRNRLKVLKDFNYKCIECAEFTNDVHHKDGSKTNHKPSNLIPLCRKCHRKYNKPMMSKYRKLYGYTSTELAKLLNVNRKIIIKWHREQKLVCLI
jgi:5-methylcytosine-specific restriction endonuclease McrA